MGTIEHPSVRKRPDGRERLYRTVLRRIGDALVAADEDCTDEYVPASQLAGAVSLADVCAFLRSARREDPATGRDRRMSGWASAADELEREFGGQCAAPPRKEQD